MPNMFGMHAPAMAKPYCLKFFAQTGITGVHFICINTWLVWSGALWQAYLGMHVLVAWLKIAKPYCIKCLTQLPVAGVHFICINTWLNKPVGIVAGMLSMHVLAARLQLQSHTASIASPCLALQVCISCALTYAGYGRGHRGRHTSHACVECGTPGRPPFLACTRLEFIVFTTI